MGNKVFTVRDLSFSYGKHKVIENLNLDIEEGKITTLIGPNGCGKSTLFNLLTKNLKADGGEIFLDGENISSMKLMDFAKKVAIVHQYNTAPSDITVERLIEYGRTPHKCVFAKKMGDEDREKINWALEITGLESLRDKEVANLSGGQRQMVWIALALTQGTKTLFLDEPTTYLDIKHQLEILGLVRELKEKYKMTVIMVLHDINQALYYSQEIIAMKDGKIISRGRPEDIINEDLIEEIYNVRLRLEEVDSKPIVMAF